MSKESDEQRAREGTLFVVMLIAIVFFAILFIDSAKADGQETQGQLILEHPILLGNLDKENDLRPVIEENIGFIHACFEPALHEDPEVYGRVVIKFTINRYGDVGSAKVNSTSLHNDVVEACLCSVFQQMDFPSPEGGGLVIVTQGVSIGQRPTDPDQISPELAPRLIGPPQGSGIRWDLLPREEDPHLIALDQAVDEADKAVKDARTFFNTVAVMPHDDPHRVNLLTQAFKDLEEAIDNHEETVKARDAYLDQIGR